MKYLIKIVYIVLIFLNSIWKSKMSYFNKVFVKFVSSNIYSGWKGREIIEGELDVLVEGGVGGEMLQAKLLNGWRRSSPKNVIIKTNVEF